MDAADRVSLRERQNINAIFEVFGMVSKAFSPEPLFIKFQCMNHGAHRSIENSNAMG